MTRKQTKSARKVRLGCHLCRSGFTLVEVLVVTVIIGILLALVSATVFAALQNAKEFAITSEATNLTKAIKAFDAHYGSGYPPADLSSTDLYKFVLRTFPHFTEVPDPDDPNNRLPLNEDRLRVHLQNLEDQAGSLEGIYIDGFDPGQALVFWLVGFSDNPADPFAGHGGRMRGKNPEKAFYDFDPKRLGKRNEDGVWTVHYYPELAGGVDASTINSRAFLYFDKKAYTAPYEPAESLPEFSAYQKGAAGDSFYNPQGFQIINAGLDGQLGVGAVSYTDADADNIANFAGGTVGDYTDQ